MEYLKCVERVVEPNNTVTYLLFSPKQKRVKYAWNSETAKGAIKRKEVEIINYGISKSGRFEHRQPINSSFIDKMMTTKFDKNLDVLEKKLNKLNKDWSIRWGADNKNQKISPHRHENISEFDIRYSLEFKSKQEENFTVVIEYCFCANLFSVEIVGVESRYFIDWTNTFDFVMEIVKERCFSH